MFTALNTTIYYLCQSRYDISPAIYKYNTIINVTNYFYNTTTRKQTSNTTLFLIINNKLFAIF